MISENLFITLISIYSFSYSIIALLYAVLPDGTMVETEIPFFQLMGIVSGFVSLLFVMLSCIIVVIYALYMNCKSDSSSSILPIRDN
jgi:hypothetical protein